VVGGVGVGEWWGVRVATHNGAFVGYGLKRWGAEEKNVKVKGKFCP
jgi:hypothetical protein